MATSATLIEQNRDDGVLVVTGVGEWIIDQADRLDEAMHQVLRDLVAWTLAAPEGAPTTS